MLPSPSGAGVSSGEPASGGRAAPPPPPAAGLDRTPPSSTDVGSLRVTVAIEQTAAWNVVAERLEAFVAAWESGSEPALAPFLPEASPALRRLVLVELVKVDLDFRIRSGRAARVEDYLADHPEIADAAGPPVELVCEEYHLRKSRGEGIDLAELCGRFPGRAAELRRWLAGTERTITTSLAADIVRAEFQPGHTVDDFHVLAEVGRGAFATVYLARQISIGRIVALKVSGDRGDEARTLAQLDHPHIVRIHDQRRLEAAADRPRMRLGRWRAIRNPNLRDFEPCARFYFKRQESVMSDVLPQIASMSAPAPIVRLIDGLAQVTKKQSVEFAHKIVIHADDRLSRFASHFDTNVSPSHLEVWRS